MDSETETETETGIETGAAGAGPAFAVRVRVTWRGVWQLIATLILFLASAGFVAGGVMGGTSVGGVMFTVLGFTGLVLFGTGLFMAAGGTIARRPVLELDADGVRRPARWPLPRKAGRKLPWADVAAITALRRGVGGTRRGEQDYIVFLPTRELAELARTSERPRLVALTMRDVPATAAAVPWCFAVEHGWDATLPQVVKEARARRRVPVIDRRTK
ncbi:hypothetical protein [Actinomadura sp. 7K507]|uniref:hypothetical protein n=1 Tax=Actinomadura sp. 7K507 TaxID=2530365 RepID=UPI0010536279|nr:hypothetical protein [Actinomadura sp. 7K507]TDC87230.1 hypothetical protein E1285_20900 [Actinomadura sp. 7K507]